VGWYVIRRGGIKMNWSKFVPGFIKDAILKDYHRSSTKMPPAEFFT
jgi:hypothetical protein